MEVYDIPEIFYTALETAHIDDSRFFILQAGSSIMSERMMGGENYQSILVFFSNEYLADFCLKNYLDHRQAKGNGKAIYVFDKDDFIDNYERSLQLLIAGNFQSQPLLQRAKLDEILLYLSATYPDQWHSFVTAALNDELVSFKKVVESNLESNLTVPELAFLCHVSVSTFKRKFAEIYNTTPGKFFIARKMTRAVDLLHREKRPSEISVELGYENLSAFSNEFKKHFGASPTAYLRDKLNF